MIKNKFNIVALAAMLTACLLTGCSDDFLKEKQDYNNYSPEIYETYIGALRRVDDIYTRQLPTYGGFGPFAYRQPNEALPGTDGDPQSLSTEEFTGFSWYIDPERPITDEVGSDLFHNELKTSRNSYGEIRNCNDVLDGVQKSEGLTEDEKKLLMGQAYFFRAWQYYLLVRNYGGMPIVRTLVATDVEEVASLNIPRSTTKECVEFICEDLDKAAELLPVSWSASDFGRVTKGTALAIKGRLLLLYASPLFNRKDNHDRWQAAYDANVAAVAALTEGGFGLAYADGSYPNAGGWSKMFSDATGFNPEAVFVTLYNKVHQPAGSNNDIWKYNGTEKSLRPSNAGGGGGKGVTEQMVDMFPMADGRRTHNSPLGYDKLLFWKNRDPRFYRTFAFPGVRWRFDGDPTKWTDRQPNNLYAGKDYVLWSYGWYKTAANKDNIEQGMYAADGLAGGRSVYLRKRTNDFDVNPASLTMYNWPTADSKGNIAGAFGECSMPYIEMRYAEVLLNLAEAAVGIGQTGEAFEILKQIRRRAGYDEAKYPTFGLEDNADRGLMFEQILYERRVEFAYEGKRYHDMRRWLLFDGGAGFETMGPPSWKLEGFYGNTCGFLGLTPIAPMPNNGVAISSYRRDNLELHYHTVGNEETAVGQDVNGNDPLYKQRQALTPLDLMYPLDQQEAAIADLEKFYKENLVRKTRLGDKIGLYGQFNPRNYFLGFRSVAQRYNTKLQQTIGWPDNLKGGADGTFDPLAE